MPKPKTPGERLFDGEWLFNIVEAEACDHNPKYRKSHWCEAHPEAKARWERIADRIAADLRPQSPAPSHPSDEQI